MNDRREDWQNQLDDRYPWHDDWHHGYWHDHWGNYWEHMWEAAPRLVGVWRHRLGAEQRRLHVRHVGLHQPLLRRGLRECRRPTITRSRS